MLFLSLLYTITLYRNASEILMLPKKKHWYLCVLCNSLLKHEVFFIYWKHMNSFNLSLKKYVF